MIYDLIIIGAGPAGMTAGIYATRREMKVLILSEDVGGQMIWSTEIENYPGFKSIQSYDLINKMKEQTVASGAKIVIDEIKAIKKTESGDFTLYSNKNEYAAKSVIIALGLKPRRLAIPGETEFVGKGVSYCANCDGPLYKNKTVAVIGGGNSALDAAEVLSKIAAKVYLIHRRDTFRGFEALVETVKGRENIEMRLDSEVKEISGAQKLEKITILNNKSGQPSVLDIDGLFIEVGRIANTDLVSELVQRNVYGQIIVDRKCFTATEGLFAAGDVTDVPYKQISIACGQGTIAALTAYEYLQTKQGKKVESFLDRGKKKR